MTSDQMPIRAVEPVAHAVTALLFAAGFFFVAYMAGLRLSSSRGILMRWVATIAALLWVPTALFHLLALPRMFRPVPALLAIALLAGLAFRLGGGKPRLRHGLAQDAVFVRRVTRLLRKSRHRGIVFAFFVCAAPGLLRALLLPPLGWDTLTYHAVKAGMWVQNGGVDSMVGTGPWGYYQNMLAGGEVFSAWAMLPLRADTLVTAVDVAQWLMLGFVLIVLARRLALREPFASAAAGFVLAIPTVKLIVGSAYVELGLLLAVAVGLTLGLGAWSVNRGGALGLAGGALGVAAATKVSMVPLAGGIAIVILIRALRTARWGAAAMAAFAFAVALSPWLLRTVSRTGLPFSPLPVTVGGLTLGEASPEVQWYMERPGMPAYVLEAELGVLRRVFASPGTQTEALGFFAAIPLGLSLLGLRRLAVRSRPGFLLVSIVALVDIACYYAPDFSMIRHYWAASSSRFLLPLVALLTLVSVSWCRPSSGLAQLYLAFLRVATFFNLLASAVTGFSPVSIEGLSILIGAGMVLSVLTVSLSARPWRAVSFAVLTVAALLGIESLRGRLRNDLFAQDFALHATPKYWTAAVGLVDDPDVARRIAITSGPHQNIDNWFASPFLGRSLQNEVVYEPVSADGIIRRFGPGDMNAEMVRTASFEAWHRRIRERRVTDVMSFMPPSIELGWMETHPELFEKRHGDRGSWGLFKVK